MNIHLPAIITVLIFANTVAGQTIEVDASNVLNRHADQVGIWVNTNSDHNNEALVKALLSLNVKTIRYGWQCGVLDTNDLTRQVHSPQDANFSGYLTDGKGRMWENFGPAGVVDLMKKTDTKGFAVLSTDGINYIGTSDAAVAKLTPNDRLNRYANHATEWATWARSNPFEYFEIGNENDLSGDTHTRDAIAPWKPAEYAQVARRFLTDIKRANPDAKCGINGGLKEAAFTDRWFKEIVEAEPSLAEDLDFIVAHKYEMWLDYGTWAKHPDWDLGRLGADYRANHARHFSKLPVHVTELGPWKEGENRPHYRAVLATEMLGNVRMDSAVHHVQFWPTRWLKDGVLTGADCQLTSMGLGMAAYTRFAQPTMFAVGATGTVRYFAARGENAATFWFVNHAATATRITCKASNLPTFFKNEWWSLESVTNSATAEDTTLRQVGAVHAERQNKQLVFTVSAAPSSVTIIRFEGNAE